MEKNLTLKIRFYFFSFSAKSDPDFFTRQNLQNCTQNRGPIFPNPGPILADSETSIFTQKQQKPFSWRKTNYGVYKFIHLGCVWRETTLGTRPLIWPSIVWHTIIVLWAPPLVQELTIEAFKQYKQLLYTCTELTPHYLNIWCQTPPANKQLDFVCNFGGKGRWRFWKETKGRSMLKK